MTSFLIVLAVFIIIISIALGFFVLIQESKGGGLASNFAGSNQIMGVRKTTNIVEIITWSLAGLIFLCFHLQERVQRHPSAGSAHRTG